MKPDIKRIEILQNSGLWSVYIEDSSLVKGPAALPC